MLLASLIDAGINAGQLERHLKRALRLKNWALVTKRIRAGHNTAVQVRVLARGKLTFDSPYRMRRLIAGSKLPGAVREKSILALDTLIQAESRVHGVPCSKVHFHELNSIDTIIDITGVLLGFYNLGSERIYSSPLNLGTPAPATLEIVHAKRIPVLSKGEFFELTTPTGAALISVLVDSFASVAGAPAFVLKRYGYGAGEFGYTGSPDVLQLFVGYDEGGSAGYLADRVIIFETNIDDMDPRLYPYVMEELFKAGALDVWLTNITMKHGRPGVMLCVLLKPGDEDKIRGIIFKETTTLGVRKRCVLIDDASRWKLPRKKRGKYKIGFLPDGSRKTAVEYRSALKDFLKTT